MAERINKVRYSCLLPDRLRRASPSPLKPVTSNSCLPQSSSKSLALLAFLDFEPLHLIGHRAVNASYHKFSRPLQTSGCRLPPVNEVQKVCSFQGQLKMPRTRSTGPSPLKAQSVTRLSPPKSVLPKVQGLRLRCRPLKKRHIVVLPTTWVPE